MSAENIQRAYQAQLPNRHCPFGDPQAIADFNAAERKRRARTPYGQHEARMRAFVHDPSNDHLSDEEYDARFNEAHRVSFEQFKREVGYE